MNKTPHMTTKTIKAGLIIAATAIASAAAAIAAMELASAVAEDERKEKFAAAMALDNMRRQIDRREKIDLSAKPSAGAQLPQPPTPKAATSPRR